MRKFLALSFALAIFVPLAACGGGDDEDSSSSSASASGTEDEEDEEESEDEGDVDAFCAGVEEVAESDFDDLVNSEDPDDIEEAGELIAALEDDVPEEISEEFEFVLEGFPELVDLVAEVADGADEDEIFEENEEFLTEFGETTDALDEFTLEECGITVDGETEADDTDTDTDTTEASGEDTSLEDFADDVEACEDGDMAVCDQLFAETPVDSEAETVGATCGGRSEERIPTQCEATFG